MYVLDKDASNERVNLLYWVEELLLSFFLLQFKNEHYNNTHCQNVSCFIFKENSCSTR